jgi:peptidoglycan hydrolase CwlO-like protein
VTKLQGALKEATDKLEDMKCNAEKGKEHLVSKLQDNEQMITALKQQVDETNKLLEKTKQGELSN